MEAQIKTSLTETFPGIEDHILEYLTNAVHEAEDYNKDTLVELLQPFVESYGLVANEAEIPAAIEAFCNRLHAVTNGAAKQSDELELLDKPTSLRQLADGNLTDREKEQLDSMWGFDKVRQSRNELMDITGAISKRNERRAEQEQRKWLDDLEKQFAQEQDEDEAQITAMTLPDYSSGSNDKDINVHSISIYFGGGELLDSADLKLAFGRRYGLVGPNGVGKTTLLRHMAAFDIEGFPRHHRVLHVKQEVKSSDKSVLEAVLAADVERTKLLETEKALLEEQKALPEDNTAEHVKVAAQLQECYERLNMIGASTAESRAGMLLAGLQFTPEMQEATIDSLSGGWRMRVAIAGALFIEPDLLMLDEPTNHLDLEAVLWLQEYLKSYKNTVIIVSHDREFLNEVSTDIIHFHRKKLVYYRGNFDSFEVTRAEQLLNQRRLFEAQQEKMKHMQEFVDKFRYNAKRAALVQSRIKAIERLDEEAVDEVVEDARFKFSFPDPGEVGSPVIQVEGVTFGYVENKLLFHDVHFGIDLASRIGILGPNGSGKSTLLNVIRGILRPISGTVRINSGLRIATFSQHHSDSFNLRLSAVQNMQTRYPDVQEQDLRAHIGRFQITGNDAMKPMKFMSGGQKSRVAFAQLTYARPHIVILDEPTNHLDMDAIEALIDALKEYKGGLLVVSHDQHFITQVCNELWVCGGNEVQRFDGSFNDYKQLALRRTENRQRQAQALAGKPRTVA